MERSIGRIAIGAVVAFLLQIVAAPNIAVAGAQPNFALAYVLVVAIVRPDEAGNVMPFLLGLACDFMGTGPVGAEAFLFTLASFGASRAFMVLDNDTLFMPPCHLLGGDPAGGTELWLPASCCWICKSITTSHICTEKNTGI